MFKMSRNIQLSLPCLSRAKYCSCWIQTNERNCTLNVDCHFSFIDFPTMQWSIVRDRMVIYRQGRKVCETLMDVRLLVLRVTCLHITWPVTFFMGIAQGMFLLAMHLFININVLFIITCVNRESKNVVSRDY
jgi:hypothetical protein